jgi:hypothetical protein
VRAVVPKVLARWRHVLRIAHDHVSLRAPELAVMERGSPEGDAFHLAAPKRAIDVNRGKIIISIDLKILDRNPASIEVATELRDVLQHDQGRRRPDGSKEDVL